MKKLLAIVVLGSLLVGCNQNRNDEYSCMHSDKSGSTLVSITKEYIIDGKQKIKISKETNDRIIAVLYPDTKYSATYTFYKRTKKYSVAFKKSGDVFILDCAQLN